MILKVIQLVSFKSTVGISNGSPSVASIAIGYVIFKNETSTICVPVTLAKNGNVIVEQVETQPKSAILLQQLT